jgi:aminoglycoside 6-adenylyltransferase
MRSEKEMLKLIIDTATKDERIRAVIMNGSSTNPNSPRDPFQDFDIVYLVTEVDAFKYDRD